MDELAREAMQARLNSYSPYSHFRVGAALRAKSGRLYLGCNVENCSYGLTVCAERVALYNAVAAGEREFEAMAIFTDADTITPPCGACRQVLSEFSKDLVIILSNPMGERRLQLSELLPMPFERQGF